MKKIIKALRDHSWKKWLRQHNCKIGGGVSSLGAKTRLILEENVSLGNVIINAKQLSIGAHTYIRSGCVLSAVSSIGRFCSIGSNCYIGQDKNTHPSDWVSSHPFQFTNTSLSFAPEIVDVTIGDDVWIGHSAMIMEGVTVGTGAIIATRAVVLHDVPPYAIVAGFPAKVIKYRHPPELADRLLNSKWWECDVDFLLTLRLDEPETALPQLTAVTHENLASYKRLEVSREGCRVMPG
ncbi:TPA: antibiotic acetyltransferase [Pseudomonas putida]|nr:antibiotic acetyltransferase [Pseudomonas putida]